MQGGLWYVCLAAFTVLRSATKRLMSLQTRNISSISDLHISNTNYLAFWMPVWRFLNTIIYLLFFFDPRIRYASECYLQIIYWWTFITVLREICSQKWIARKEETTSLLHWFDCTWVLINRWRLCTKSSVLKSRFIISLSLTLFLSFHLSFSRLAFSIFLSIVLSLCLLFVCHSIHPSS